MKKSPPVINFSQEWSYNETYHWHGSTCGHDVVSNKESHIFDETWICTKCAYKDTNIHGVEIRTKSLELNKTNLFGKVSNDTTAFSFINEIEIAKGATFGLYFDFECQNEITDKIGILTNIGDNVFYILVKNGDASETYTVKIRRRSIYTVVFDTTGGSSVVSQSIEEDSFATAPTAERTGYNFDKWDYDFSNAITQDTTITASWIAIKYSIKYDFGISAESASQIVDNSMNPATYTIEDETVFGVPSRTGYNFIKWDRKIDKGTTGDVIVIASWEAIEYDIFYDFDDANSKSKATNNSQNPFTYTIEDTVSFANPSREGYDFITWSIPSIAKGSMGTVKTTASWLVIEYSITYNLNEGTNHPDNPQKFTVEKLPIVLKDANFAEDAFLGWGTTNSSSDKTISAITTIGNITVYALFGSTEGLQYSLSDDGSYYLVSGYTGTEGNIVIGKRYNNKPIKAIADKAFERRLDIVAIKLSDSIINIGVSALFGCTNLTNLVIPDSVTSIGERAFEGCTGLTSVTIGNSVTSIGNYAFYGCTGLIGITIPDSVTSIGNSAFDGCTGLTSVTIGNSVTSIGNSAFYDCTGLTSITIPDSVTSIGYSAFKNCNGLTKITGPSEAVSVVAKQCGSESFEVVITSGTSIEKEAFIECKNLIGITIGNSVTNIGDHAFAYCKGLTSVTIGNGVTSIGNHAFDNCTGLTSVTIGKSVTSIGKSAFYGCTNLKDIYYAGSVAGWCGISGLGNLMSDSHTLYINGAKLEGDLIIPDGVTRVGEYAFSECTGLASVIIPDSVTSIGDRVFARCTRLTSVTIPVSVTSIGYSAFYGCTGLTSVTIGNGVMSIGNYAFSECTGLASVIIPDSVTSIGDSVFARCTRLTSVTIGNGVTSIRENAFYDCELKEVVVGERNESYASVDGILYNKAKTEIILVPKAKQGSITIPDSVTSIDYKAFYNCSGLTSVTIPDSVTSIGEGAFYGCTGLTNVTIPNSVTIIGSYAFEDCNKLIEVYNKSSLNITAGSKENGYVAYYAKNVYTEEGGSKLSTDENGYVIYADGNEKILVAYMGTEVDLILPSFITQIYHFVFRDCSGLKSVTIGNSVTSIGEYAFYNCEGLTSITIPDSVTDIGFAAFVGCTGLTSITIPDRVTTIGNYVFAGCTGLTSITIPDGVTSIGDGVFEDCTGLTSVTIGNGVTSIGENASIFPSRNCVCMACKG